MKRKDPQLAKNKEEFIGDYIPIVDADYMLYKAGMAGQYELKHMTCKKTGEILATFRYVKDYKKWLEETGNVLGESVIITKQLHVDPLGYVLHSLKLAVLKLQDQFGHPPRLYLTGKGNFREEVAKEQPYKGNRWGEKERSEALQMKKWLKWLEETEDKWTAPQRPLHKKDMIDYLVTQWDAVVIDGMEADDACSIEMCKDPTGKILVHVDKDLNMVPGMHFEPTKKVVYEVSETEGLQWFYRQLLMGDNADNIPGIPKIDKKRSYRILEGLNTEWEMFSAVYDKYVETYPDLQGEDIVDMITNRGRLLYMLKEENEVWCPPYPPEY